MEWSEPSQRERSLGRLPNIPAAIACRGKLVWAAVVWVGLYPEFFVFTLVGDRKILDYTSYDKMLINTKSYSTIIVNVFTVTDSAPKRPNIVFDELGGINPPNIVFDELGGINPVVVFW